MPVGIDLGSQQLKVVELKPAGEAKFSLVAVGGLRHNFNWWSQKKADIGEIKQALGKFWREHKFTTNKVNTALPEAAVYTKVIKRPILSDPELNSVLKFELEQFIPVPVDKVYYSFTRLTKVNEGKKVKELILVAASPKDRVDQLLSLSSQLGLVVEVLETAMVSLARSLTFNRKNPALIIDLGHSQFSLGVAKAGRLYVRQRLDLSGAALTRLLARTLNIDEPQAEQIKTSYGLDKKQSGGKVADILTTAFDQLITEARRVIAFYEDKVLAEKVKEIILSGGGALMPELGGFINRRLGLDVSLPNFFNLINNLPESVAKQPHLYAQAIGLAMRREF